MRAGKPLAVFAATTLALAAGARAEGVDPRTPAGQLEACGGAANWNAVGYLEFAVSVEGAAGEQGPWHYDYDKTHGHLRMNGPWPGGGDLVALIDIGSRTGGGWANGTQLTGAKLKEAVGFVLRRFGEDILYLTFPLEWSAAGVGVTPLPDVTLPDGKLAPAVAITAASGTWKVTLDPDTGRVAQTVLGRHGSPDARVVWSDWAATGGVFFAHRRTDAQIGQTVEVKILRVLPAAPPGVF
jgi:hypothetical protein